MQKEIPIGQIVVDKNQPRKLFDEAKLKRLKNSIVKHGIKIPLVVEETDKKDIYFLEDGERRFRAAKELGLKVVPVIVEPSNDKLQHLVSQFHLQELHEPWSFSEKAEAVEELSQVAGMKDTEIAELLGLSRHEVHKYHAFHTIINKEEMKRNNISNEYVRALSLIKKTVQKTFHRDELPWSKDIENKLEKSFINAIKDGSIQNGSQAKVLRDTFSKDSSLVDEFIKGKNIQKLYRDSDAVSETLKRRIMNGSQGISMRLSELSTHQNVKPFSEEQKRALRSLVGKINKII